MYIELSKDIPIIHFPLFKRYDSYLEVDHEKVFGEFSNFF